MHQKLSQQPNANQNAGQIRRDSGGISDHLENGDLVIFWVKAGLEKSFSRIAQRVVHFDQDIAFFAVRRVAQMNFAGEIFLQSGFELEDVVFSAVPSLFYSIVCSVF